MNKLKLNNVLNLFCNTIKFLNKVKCDKHLLLLLYNCNLQNPQVHERHGEK